MKNEWKNAMQARKWMKKNESFLYPWHAYIGSELKLFDEFKEPATIEEVAVRGSYPEDLLHAWVNVGVALKHLKKEKDGTFRTSQKRCSALMGEDASPGVQALLKEMMELHIPTLLSYPTFMQSEQRASFDHERFGGIVAETSALLEHFAIRKIRRKVREANVKTIVDLGCGHGGYLRKLADHFPDIKMIGVDINESVIDNARYHSEDYSNVSFEVGDITSWKPEEEDVDMILLHNIFHYINPIERAELLNHLGTYLREGGMISVITPINETEFGEAFSSAFNSFFVAHENLFALPTQKDLDLVCEEGKFKLTDLDPIIKEGSWYTFWLSPKQKLTTSHESGSAEIEKQVQT
ncbi:class I SAM-dependent methyltransferase [Thalassobacillus hwangdonensis]|uniref:Class I SAM-dependent methyltransferase n=1 Tax=Thalassobacillus hwangdonensis TaxID=546108 RepID=A0ABW3L445_9BACI